MFVDTELCCAGSFAEHAVFGGRSGSPLDKTGLTRLLRDTKSCSRKLPCTLTTGHCAGGNQDVLWVTVVLLIEVVFLIGENHRKKYIHEQYESRTRLNCYRVSISLRT